MDADDRPIGELFGQLIDDGKSYARAEIGLVRARVEVHADRARKPLLFGGIAAILALAAVIALALTLVLALASLLGPFGGGVAATLLIAAAAGLFGWLAKSSWERGA